MPYILLSLGLLIGLYALYRFFLRANVAQIKALGFTLATLVLCAALFFMAVTGRLPAAIALVAALAPFVMGWLRFRKAAKEAKQKTPEQNAPLSRKEALEILGLKEGANREEIKAAYNKLMKKVHPDQEGSGWMAAKLNAAKDLLLKE